MKVGVVYKTDGPIDIRSLPSSVKLKVLTSHLIDNSVFLSGDFSKREILEEESELKKIDQYTEAINSYLFDPKFEFEEELYIIFDEVDKDIVKTVLGGPEYAIYSKQFLEFNEDLITLEALRDSVVILRRIL